jgi:hypothetical protein
MVAGVALGVERSKAASYTVQAGTSGSCAGAKKLLAADHLQMIRETLSASYRSIMKRFILIRTRCGHGEPPHWEEVAKCLILWSRRSDLN